MKLSLIFVVLLLGCAVKSNSPQMPKSRGQEGIDYTVRVVETRWNGGKPISGVRILVSQKSSGSNRVIVCEPTDCLTNKDGVVVVKNLRGGAKVKVSMSKDGYSSLSTLWFNLPKVNHTITFVPPKQKSPHLILCQMKTVR